MSEIAKVAEFKLTPRPDVVSLLEHYLAQAKAGHLRAAVVVTHCDTENTSGGYALGDGDVAHLMLALEYTKLRLLQEKG